MIEGGNNMSEVNDKPETSCGRCEKSYQEPGRVTVCSVTREMVCFYTRDDNCPKDKGE